MIISNLPYIANPLKLLNFPEFQNCPHLNRNCILKKERPIVLCKWIPVLVCCILMYVQPAWGHEVSVLGGIIRDADTHDRVSMWQFEYFEPVSPNFAWSLTYLNEGHFPDHHRDGTAFQLWVRSKPLYNRFFLQAGFGPYLYFDTTERLGRTPFKNEHGLGGIFSGVLGCRLDEHLILQARMNYIWTDGNINTLSVLGGIGIEFEVRPLQGFQRETSERNAVTLFIGRMVSNNSDSDSATAWKFEYRRRFGNRLEASAAYLDEGDNGSFHRDGVAFQLWAVNHFFEERLTLGVGLGPYFARNRHRDLLTGKDGDIFAGILAATADYRFSPHWSVRASWDRVFTDYDRDTDVFLAGLSFHF